MNMFIFLSPLCLCSGFMTECYGNGVEEDVGKGVYIDLGYDYD